MRIHHIAFIIILSALSCNNKINDGKINFPEKDSNNSTGNQPDTSVLFMTVERIKVYVDSINLQLEGYEADTKTVLGYASEGTEITSYRENKSLKKMEVVHLGETGRLKEEYYFKDTIMVYSYKVSETYKKPLHENKNPEISKKIEEEFFLDNTLLLWTKDKVKVIDEKGSYKKKADELRSLVFRYQKDKDTY